MLRIPSLSFSALTLATLLAACGDDTSTAAAETVTPSLLAQEARTPSSPLSGLARGKREVLVAGIPTAENILFLSDGRLLVTGDKGLYLLTRDEAGQAKAKNLQPTEPCAFGGMVEVAGVVYANCYDFKQSSIYAARLADLDFEPVVELPKIALANSLTTDGRHLYVSATLQSKIIRLTIDQRDPRSLTGQTDFVSGLNALLPNGAKVYDGTLYWNDLAALKSVRLDGKAPRTLKSQLSLFDDLYVDARGIVVADYVANVLRAFDFNGKQLAQTPAAFQAPSAVVPALGRFGLGQQDWVVTERGGNVVSVYRVGQ